MGKMPVNTNTFPPGSTNALEMYHNEYLYTLSFKGTYFGSGESITWNSHCRLSIPDTCTILFATLDTNRV